MTLTAEQKSAVQRVVQAVDGRDHPYCRHEFNVHRWLVAYDNDEEEVVKVLRRHLNIRECVQLEDLAAGRIPIDTQLESFVPITFLGQNQPDDNKVVLFESTGKIDIGGLVGNIRMNNFMKIKFRMMEQLHERVVEEEKRSGKQSGGVLIMDLQGLPFSTKLIATLTGPYRIMWGTLFDHYPQLLQQIVVVNAPTYVNVLHQAFSPFLPNDYKEKIVISSYDAATFLPTILDTSCLPEELGGANKDTTIPEPETPFPVAEPFETILNAISVPAGKFVVQKFSFDEGNKLEFNLQNDSCFHYFMFYSKIDTKKVDDWTEITVGCERPALKQVDVWNWSVPKTGFYYIRYGNEGSWVFSVTVNSQISEARDGQTNAVPPLETFII